MMMSDHCVSLPLMVCDSHPERVVLLGQIGQDVGVEHSSLQETRPQSSQLGAELAHIPADLLCYLIMSFLQLMGTEKIYIMKLNIKQFPKLFLNNTISKILGFLAGTVVCTDTGVSVFYLSAWPDLQVFQLLYKTHVECVNQLTQAVLYVGTAGPQYQFTNPSALERHDYLMS